MKMTKSNCEICCIIPTKNQGKYISESIDSILNQTFKNFHLIIIDNNSTDDTSLILKEYEKKWKNSIYPKVTIDKEMNPGTGAALNKGLLINSQTTNCKYLTWWASDNYLATTAFEEMKNVLDKNGNVDMVYANIDIHIFNDDNKLLKVKNLKEEVGNQEWINDNRIFTNYFLGIVWLFRKEICEKAGEWYIHEPCEDFDQVIRFVFAGGKFKFLDKNLGWFRRHVENLSNRLKNTGYPESLVANMIKIRNNNKGKEYIEYVRWKYNPLFYAQRKSVKFENWEEQMKENVINEKKLFTEIYKNNKWGGKESVSGKGSDIEQTRRIVNRIPHLLKKYEIKSVLDIGCGDLNWMKQVLSQYDGKYIGVDIVDEMIEKNKIDYPFYDFYIYNILEENLYNFNCDLIICRDVLPHYAFSSILSILYKIANSNNKYLLTTTFTRYDRKNVKDIDIKKGISWRAINLVKSPINLQDPIEVINERCSQIDTDGSDFKDKSLALWKISDIRKSLNLSKTIIDLKPINELKKNSKNIVIKEEKKVWHLKKIDKVINFYWGNKQLPYLRYLTVKTFSILNPDWEIHFYRTENNSEKITWSSNEHKFNFKFNEKNDYSDELRKINNIKFFKIDDRKFINFPEVYKSDILRWRILSKKPGVWADMDIIFIKPMNECDFNQKENENFDTGVQICDMDANTYHTIGFMLSSGNDNEYFTYIKNKITKEKIDFHNYQSFGVVLLNYEFPNLNKIKEKFKKINLFNIDKDLLYSFYPIERIKEMFKINGRDYTNKKTIGIHWYGGYELSGEFCNRIDHENIWKEHCLLAEKIQNILKIEK